MELLYFIGKDAPINIITSSTQPKMSPPIYNIHVKTGGIDIHEIKSCLLNDNDQYNDIFYLVIPETFATQFQLPSIKWILSRKHANVLHILLCDVNLYDSLTHKPFFKETNISFILQQIFHCHSPFARILSTINNTKTDLDKKLASEASSSNLFVDVKSNNYTKLYAGLILDTFYDDINKIYNPEFIVDLTKNQLIKEDGYSFIYLFDDGNKILTKRSLSQILCNYKQIQSIQNVQLVCKDINFPNPEIINQLQQNLFPFTCVKQHNSCKNTITLFDDTKIENLALFLNTIRKLPLFSSFTKVVFNYIPTILFDEVVNEIFVTINLIDETSAKCFLETEEQSHETIIMPLIPSCRNFKEEHQQNNNIKPKYFMEKFGEDDLGEQMTQFACVVKAFQPLVESSKDLWKACKIKDVFQNVDYECVDTNENNFSLAYYPTPHSFIFKSSIYYQALNYLSTFTSQNMKVIGVHQKRKRLGTTTTQKCNVKYYKDSIESIKQNFQSSRLHFLLFNDVHNLKEICGSYTLVKEINDGLSLAILSLCDGLILSTSSFSWWAGTLNKKAIIYAPKKWIEPSLFSSELERKFSSNEWNHIDN